MILSQIQILKKYYINNKYYSLVNFKKNFSNKINFKTTSLLLLFFIKQTYIFILIYVILIIYHLSLSLQFKY